jgi:hypothetical protein
MDGAEPGTWAEDVKSYRQDFGSQSYAVSTPEHLNTVRCAQVNTCLPGVGPSVNQQRSSCDDFCAVAFDVKLGRIASGVRAAPSRKAILLDHRYTRSVPSLTPVGEPKHPMFGALAETVHRPSESLPQHVMRACAGSRRQACASFREHPQPLVPATLWTGATPPSVCRPTGRQHAALTVAWLGQLGPAQARRAPGCTAHRWVGGQAMIKW